MSENLAELNISASYSANWSEQCEGSEIYCLPRMRVGTPFTCLMDGVGTLVHGQNFTLVLGSASDES